MTSKDFLKAHDQRRYSIPTVPSKWDVRVKIMLNMLRPDPQRVLDVGCYDGVLSQPLVERGWQVYGLDHSAPAVELAKKRGIQAQQADLDVTWPMDSESMDAVLAGEIIEHVMDVDTFVNEAYRVLKPGGRFVVSTPNLATLGRRLMLLLGMNPLIEISFTGGAAGHVRYFTPAVFIKFITSKGFRLREWTSDVVNFNASGSLRSALLARLFPSLGRGLIGSFEKP